MSAESLCEGQFSHVIDTAARQPREAFRFSVLGHQEALDELAETWEQCRNAGWDGYDALPVDLETFRYAYVLIDTLPLGFPRPSMGAEPDGQLTLEWHKSSARSLSVSVDPNGFLHYAGFFGADRRYGTLAFYSSAPDTLIQLVREL